MNLYCTICGVVKGAYRLIHISGIHLVRAIGGLNLQIDRRAVGALNYILENDHAKQAKGLLVFAGAALQQVIVSMSGYNGTS